MQSSITFVLLFAFIGASLAHPMPEDMTMPSTPPPQYPLNLQGGGGGQRSDGFGFGVSGREKVWTSDNGRHEIGVNGGYGQHLGGPYGNSEPSWNVGTSYTYRFPNRF
ncbi:diptericin A [Drosophila takahashii]|uniref:diptericin A n=1 Tax=Drosophila takahashii TaxID=29030 RepID=UPI001CF8BE84|nr:diptericin A [Drosophila takahashii]